MYLEVNPIHLIMLSFIFNISKKEIITIIFKTKYKSNSCTLNSTTIAKC